MLGRSTDERRKYFDRAMSRAGEIHEALLRQIGAEDVVHFDREDAGEALDAHLVWTSSSAAATGRSCSW